MDDLNNMSRPELIAEFKRCTERIKEMEQNERRLRSKLDDVLSNNQRAAEECEVVYRELQECKIMEEEYNEMKALVETLTEENHLMELAAPTPDTSIDSTTVRNFLMFAPDTMRIPYVRRSVLPPITVSLATTQNSTMGVFDSATVPTKVQETEMSSAAPSKSQISASSQKRIPPPASPTATTSKSAMQPSDFVEQTTPSVSSANSTVCVSTKAKTSRASTPNTATEQSESLFALTTSKTTVKPSDFVQRTMSPASSVNLTPRVSDPAQRMSSSAFPSSMKKRTDSSLAKKSTQPPCAPEPPVIASPKMPSASTPNSTLPKCNVVMASPKVPSVSTQAASAQPSDSDMVPRTSDSSANATMRVSDSAKKMSTPGFPSSMKKRSDSTLAERSTPTPSTPAKMPPASTPELVQNRMTPASSANSTILFRESNLASRKKPPAAFPSSMKKRSDYILPQTSSTSTPNSTIQPSNSVMASPQVPSASTPQLVQRQCATFVNSTLQLPEYILAPTKIPSTPVPNKQSAERLHTSFPTNNTVSASSSITSTDVILKQELSSHVEQTGSPPPPPPRSTSIRSELSDSSMTSSDETETEETTNIQVQPRPIVLRSFPARGRSFNSEFDDASPRSSAAVAKNVNDHLDNKSPVKGELNVDDATIGGSCASFSDVEYTNDEYDDDVSNKNTHDSVDKGNATLQEMNDDVPSTNTTMRPSVNNANAAALRTMKENEPDFGRKLYYNNSDEEDHPSPAWYD